MTNYQFVLLKTVKDIKNLEGKRVFLRVDFNVPLKKAGRGYQISANEDWRLRAVLPTIKFLKRKKCKIIIAAHLGRPNGWEEKFSMAPVRKRLEELLGTPVYSTEKIIDPKAAGRIFSGEILFLENLRFDRREEKNDEQFAGELAALAEIYVNDAFGSIHRNHASLLAITEFLPAYAGLLIKKEADALESIMYNSQHPLTLILGGVKSKTKLKVVKRLAGKVDNLIFGGALANTILAVKGMAIGASRGSLKEAGLIGEKELLSYLKNLNLTNTKLHLPLDVVTSKDSSGKGEINSKAVGKVMEQEKILDIGPDTVALFRDIIKESKCIIWNGPMGFAEVEVFAKGTRALARTIADASAKNIVGGGDTVALLQEMGITDKFFHVSTGGGAMLNFLAGEKMPVLEVLKM